VCALRGFRTQSKVVAQLTLLVAISGPAPWQLSRCTAEDGPTEALGSARACLSLQPTTSGDAVLALNASTGAATCVCASRFSDKATCVCASRFRVRLPAFALRGLGVQGYLAHKKQPPPPPWPP